MSFRILFAAPVLFIASLQFTGAELRLHQSKGQPIILVCFYSELGHTRAMASAVVAGAQTVENVRVLLRSVDEVSIEEVIEARGIIVGSPVYNAAVAPKVQEFINSWPFAGGEMRDKIGAAFVTGGGISAGEELVQVSLLHSMMIFGMIVVGGEEWTSAFGASAVTEEGGYRRAAKGEVDEAFLKKAESIGRRVALLVRKLNTS